MRSGWKIEDGVKASLCNHPSEGVFRVACRPARSGITHITRWSCCCVARLQRPPSAQMQGARDTFLTILTASATNL